MAILCIGQSVYDITIPIQEPIVENQKYVIDTSFECPGGPALNSAYLCGLWGADVALISRVGNDTYGECIQKTLKSVDVNLEHLIYDDDISTPYSYIFSNVKNGARTLFNFPGQLKKVAYEFPKLTVDVILSDGHEPEISVDAILKYKNAISIVDAGTCRESTLKVAKYVDYIVCSQDFARQYTGKNIELNQWEECEKIFKEIEGINHKHVVITLGEQGLLYRDGDALKHLSAYKANAIDTNGAGDIFHGAFAYGIYHEMSLLEVLKLSSMTSAISVESIGAQTSIPKLKTVMERLKE